MRGLLSDWADARMVGFDFETSGTQPEYALQPWRVASGDAWVTSLVTGCHKDGQMRMGGGLAPTKGMMRAILEQVLDEGAVMVGWNTPFDIAWFMAYGLEDLALQVRWIDGMLLWRHYFIEPEYEATNIYMRKSYGLKEGVKEFLPQHSGYEEDVDFHDPSPEARVKLHAYNQRDVVFTLYLARRFFKALQESDPRRLRTAMIEAQCLPMVAQANLRGMSIDPLAARELEQHLTDTADKRLAELAEHGMTEKVVRSPMQLARLLFGQYVVGGTDAVDEIVEPNWGLTPLKTNTSTKTKRVTNSTDKEVLYELAPVDARVAKVKEYREALNNRTKFATAPRESQEYNGDGRSHPEAKVFGTYSGRFTYASKQGRNKAAVQTGFALHQEKRDQVYRDIVQAFPGHTLVEFDAAGQEFRWMAIASDDPTMLHLCRPGEDPHAYMGAEIVRQDYHTLMAAVSAGAKEAKSARQLGKVGNLSLQYRTSAKKLRSVARVQYGIPMELPQAQEIWSTYRRVYPGVPRYWAHQIEMTRRRGYVETFSGRRVVVRGRWDGRDGWSMGSTAINYRIQGTGAEQKYLALSVLAPYLRTYDIKFGWDLHDGLYFHVPDQHLERFVQDGRKILNNLPYAKAWGFTPPIPLPWDCKTGKVWGSMKEVHYDD